MLCEPTHSIGSYDLWYFYRYPGLYTVTMLGGFRVYFVSELVTTGEGLTHY
jgi:hypothetical protein